MRLRFPDGARQAVAAAVVAGVVYALVLWVWFRATVYLLARLAHW